jgi:hypothetical protein
MTAASLEVEGKSKKFKDKYRKIDVFYKEHYIFVDFCLFAGFIFWGDPPSHRCESYLGSF